MNHVRELTISIKSVHCYDHPLPSLSSVNLPTPIDTARPIFMGWRVFRFLVAGRDWQLQGMPTANRCLHGRELSSSQILKAALEYTQCTSPVPIPNAPSL